ncbi:MAG: Tad domain-containing protein [Candidatus Eremiobacteraeota bacterium]|nr:Tad domain-containing protein [Candidatus Eremiobacteraeota bacterium]
MEFSPIPTGTGPSQQRGQVLPLIAVTIGILLMFAALATDVGAWRYSHRIQQSAVDSAAIAGASQLAFPPASVSAAAQQDATSNGFTDDGGATVGVTVNNPPATGPYAGNNGAVEVLINKKQPLFFANIIPGFGAPFVGVRAVAILNKTALNCIIALGGNIALLGGGGGGITAPTCGMATNQNLIVTGNANVNVLSASYVGNAPGGGTYPLGQPMKSLPVEDPCNSISGCAYLKKLTTGTSCVDTLGGVYPANPVLAPGDYCYNHTWNGSVTLSPTSSNALFIFDKGMPTGSLDGTAGVTIYNGAGINVTWSGNINVNVTAPTSGPTAGMAYYQPASNPNVSIVKNGKAGAVNFAGGFYSPSADFTFNGALPSISFFIASSITMNGGGMGASGIAGSSVAGHAVLAE